MYIIDKKNPEEEIQKKILYLLIAIQTKVLCDYNPNSFQGNFDEFTFDILRK